MGQPKTQQVGGGANTATANAYNQFLQNQLPGGNLGGAAAGPQIPNLPSNMPPQVKAQILSQYKNFNDIVAQGGQGQNQTTPFSQAFQGLLTGQGANQNLAPWIANMQQQSGMANISPIQQQTGYNLNAPSFQGANLNGINTTPQQFGQVGFESVGFNNPQTAQTQFGIDPNIYNRIVNSATGGINGQVGSPDFSMPAPNQLNWDLNSPIAKAASGVIQQQLDRQLADSRSRASALGGNSLGTSAIRERAMIQQDLAPQIAQAQLQAIMGQNQQEMQNYGQNTGLMLQNRGIESQHMLGAGSLGLQGQIANTNASNQQLSALLGLGGLQNQAAGLGLQGVGQNNQALNALDQLRFGQSNALNQLNLNQQQGLNNLNLQQQLGLGNLALGQNQQFLQNAGMQNDFNLNAFNSANNAANMANAMGFNIQNANNTNAMNNQQMGNQWQMGIGSLLGGMDQQALQGVMSAVNQLFGGFNQANAIGSPQAQIVQTPSAFGQLLGGISSIAGMIPGVRQALGNQAPLNAPQLLPMPPVNTMLNNSWNPNMMSVAPTSYNGNLAY